MISPFTPAGAKVVCINDDRSRSGYVGDGNMGGLTAGCVYTISKIVINPISAHPNALLVEIVRGGEHLGFGFRLERFRRVTDISSFQKLLHTAPVPREREDA